MVAPPRSCWRRSGAFFMHEKVSQPKNQAIQPFFTVKNKLEKFTYVRNGKNCDYIIEGKILIFVDKGSIIRKEQTFYLIESIKKKEGAPVEVEIKKGCQDVREEVAQKRKKLYIKEVLDTLENANMSEVLTVYRFVSSFKKK